MEKVVDVDHTSRSDSKPLTPSSSNADDLCRKLRGNTTNHGAYYSKIMSSTVHNQDINLDLPPTGKYNGGANEAELGKGFNNIGGVLGSFAGGAGAVTYDERFGTNSQPFDAFPCPPSDSYRSPGMGFTNAQWEELARQAMIYKYIISSAAPALAPIDLLFPDSRNDAVGSSPTTVYGETYPRNGPDAEPGRCKRTDGKKWRCSKDVAPHRRYCERHLSRGRPRSRKHVEAKSDVVVVGGNRKKKPTGLRRSSTLPKPTHDENETARISFSIFRSDGGGSSSSYKEAPRDLGLTVGREEQRFEQSNVDFSNMGHSIYGAYGESLPPYDQQFDAFSHSNLTVQSPINFIDDFLNINNTEVQPYLPPFACSGRGPLGEALQAGSVISSNSASPYSAPITTASSPPGILHKASLLHSDHNSVCNSPPSEGEFWRPN